MTTGLEQVPLKGPWDVTRVANFLDAERSPLRLAVNGREGFPMVCSLWFRYQAGMIWCATHESALINRLLVDDDRVAFEVSVNDPPYYGVRGQARVERSAAAGERELRALLTRYLGGTDSGLARWLLSRAAGEVALALRPVWLTSWDFSARMPGRESEGSGAGST